MIKFISCFSGIEAASVASKQLGWEAVAFSEIDKFASAVIAHHFPHVPNLGDITKVNWSLYAGSVGLVCGGSPCQAFSVAGLRKSLEDQRGNLTIEFTRAVHDIKPKWVMWENVPGTFSAAGNPFGCFMAGLAGYDSPIEPAGGKWASSGLLVAKDEESYSLAWRVLDAQYFGVPQRRRRIFLVGHIGIGCWWKLLEVLFERHRENGHPSQGRKAREEAAEDAGRGVEVIGFAQNTRDEVRLQNGDGKLSGALAAQPGMKQTTYLAIRTNQTGANGIGVAEGVAEGVAHTLDCSNGQAVGYMETVGALCARDYKGVGSQYVQEGKDLAIPMVMAHGQGGAEMRRGQAPRLTCNHEAPILAFNWQSGGDCRLDPREDQANTLQRRQTQAVAFAQNQKGELRTSEIANTVTTTSNASARGTGKLLSGYVVRRFTPIECERLQGFPDNWTRIPYRGKPAEMCPDGPRYKALGNSWAVPCARWIFERIDKVDKL